jgi:hypothetical protein
MRKTTAVLGAVLLSGLVLAGSSVMGVAATPPSIDARAYLAEHGYLPIHGVDTLNRAKAWAESAAAGSGMPVGASPVNRTAPTLGPGWNGLSETDLAPPDPNGAIGPSSYVEIINLQMGIYTRAGVMSSSIKLQALTGHSSLSDPMVLWDPDTQRFYYNVWDTSVNTMEWGFSKSSSPTKLPGDFCNYTTAFGYSAGQFTDYPKLGQTKGFLDIGINFYPTGSSLHATHSDLLWITKPQGSTAVTVCPASTSFTSGKFTNLRNQDSTQAFTPVPAIQTDPSDTGYISAMSDIECPDICGSGSKITVYSLTPKSGSPTVPVLSAPKSVTVTSYTSPPPAPQKGTGKKIDTLDGRLTHSVSGFDPTSNKTAIWLAHTVLGGAGSQIQWFEIDAVSSPLAVLQTGTVRDAKLYVLNAGISNDRTVPATGAPSHGGAMVLGFTTTSRTSFPADQMVSKIGPAAQSAFVLVKQSSTFYSDFSCRPVCRWGDYGGATPDPAALATAANGNVWLSNEWDNRAWMTWNWEAFP